MFINAFALCPPPTPDQQTLLLHAYSTNEGGKLYNDTMITNMSILLLDVKLNLASLTGYLQPLEELECALAMHLIAIQLEQSPVAPIVSPEPPPFTDFKKPDCPASVRRKTYLSKKHGTHYPRLMFVQHAK